MATIRNARPDDALHVAAVHVRSWQAAYRGLLDDEYLDALRPEDRVRRYSLGDTSPGAPMTLVAVEEGRIWALLRRDLRATRTDPERASCTRSTSTQITGRPVSAGSSLRAREATWLTVDSTRRFCGCCQETLVRNASTLRTVGVSRGRAAKKMCGA
jgi:hypothetical protein